MYRVRVPPPPPSPPHAQVFVTSSTEGILKQQMASDDGGYDYPSPRQMSTSGSFRASPLGYPTDADAHYAQPGSMRRGPQRGPSYGVLVASRQASMDASQAPHRTASMGGSARPQPTAFQLAAQRSNSSGLGLAHSSSFSGQQGGMAAAALPMAYSVPGPALSPLSQRGSGVIGSSGYNRQAASNNPASPHLRHMPSLPPSRAAAGRPAAQPALSARSFSGGGDVSGRQRSLGGSAPSCGEEPAAGSSAT